MIAGLVLVLYIPIGWCVARTNRRFGWFMRNADSFDSGMILLLWPLCLLGSIVTLFFYAIGYLISALGRLV